MPPPIMTLPNSLASMVNIDVYYIELRPDRKLKEIWGRSHGQVFEIKGRPQSAINHLIPKQQQRPSLIFKGNCALSSTFSRLTLISFINETLATNSIIFVVLANSFYTPTSRFLNWILDSSATPFLSNNNVRPT